MFVAMDDDLKFWKEKLSGLEKGKSIVLDVGQSSQSIYSAIRTNPELFKFKEFSVRTDKKPTTLAGGCDYHHKRVIRIK